VTKRTAISLPDDLYRQIERARRRARKDRSTWLQEAASEYLNRRTKEEEIEAYLSAYERMPLTDDEIAVLRWGEEHLGEVSDAPGWVPDVEEALMARPTEHAEIWETEIGERRPVVVVSRDDVAGRRDSTTVAVITRTVRGHPSEVLLDHRDGLPNVCVINCDDLHSIRKERLERRVGRLSETKIELLDDALRFALQLR